MLFFLFLDVVVLDESYPPVLLLTKARRLRHETGNWALHARHEEWDVSLKELANKFLMRPFRLLATPICLLVAVYASFCYGILYLYVFCAHSMSSFTHTHQVFVGHPYCICRRTTLGPSHLSTSLPCDPLRNITWRWSQHSVRPLLLLTVIPLTV